MLDSAMRAPDHYAKQGFSLDQLLPAIAHIASSSEIGIKYLLDGKLLRQLAIILSSETLPASALIGTRAPLEEQRVCEYTVRVHSRSPDAGASQTTEGGAGPGEPAKYTEFEKTSAAYCALQISVSEPNRPTMMRNIEILEGKQRAAALTHTRPLH